MATGEIAPTATMACPTCGGAYAAGQVYCPKDGAQLVTRAASAGGAAPGDSPVGKVLADRYRIIKKLGEGGMGEVFEAQHIYIDKRFAIKTLRPEITSNPEAVARFHQEARSASTIGHENIVEIDDFGRLPDGSVYLAMEFLDGMSLGERMKQSPPLTLTESLNYMAAVCRGLGAAHAKNIVHRDLKPENIFLARKNGNIVVKVLDFGIAKVVGTAGEQHLTQTGAIFGTPYYMSPEQALGHALDRRADIYSLGVILYEVFAGKVPFTGDSFMGILSQHITKPPLPPSRVDEGRYVSPSIERVILKAMAKDPAARYQTMEELHADLARMQSGLEVSASALRASGKVMLEAPVPDDHGAALELAEPHRSAEDGESFARTGGMTAGRKRSRAPWIAGGLVLLLGGGAAAVVVLKPFAARDPVPVVAAVVPVAPVVAPPPPPPEAKPIPEVRPGESEVVVDSVPTVAKIFADGKEIGETPDVVKVPGDKPREVLVRKDGYTPRQLLLDPTRERKVIVRLERDHRASPSSAPAPSPSPSVSLPHLVMQPESPPPVAPKPAIAPPPATTPSAAPHPHAPPHVPRQPADPYATPAAPSPRRSHSGEVLDPYQ